MTDAEKRELNEWIAKHVFGLDAETDWYVDRKAGCDVMMKSSWAPTEDEADAMKVLKKCHTQCCVETGETANIANTKRGFFARSIYKDIVSEAETLELAICLFAKKIFSK